MNYFDNLHCTYITASSCLAAHNIRVGFLGRLSYCRRLSFSDWSQKQREIEFCLLLREEAERSVHIKDVSTCDCFLWLGSE